VITKCGSAGHGNLPNWATQPRTPAGMGNWTGPCRPQPPGIYAVRRAQKPAVLPPAVPSEAHRHEAPTPVGADLMPARPLPPCGCP